MKTFIVDSFTGEAFKGNPAGVCITDQSIEAEKMLAIAGELNFSETAFIRSLGNEVSYAIRYFSPKMEIPLCGHATLAAARVLFEHGDLTEIYFLTIENIELVIQKSGDEIEMEFPLYGVEPAVAPNALLEALGIKKIENSVYNKETKILLLEITDAQELKELSPDFNALLQSHDSINGVLVTAPAQDELYDFHSRYFWPWSGTNEDPVTGGTHTFLAKYWGKKLGKTKMRSFQSSRRSGFMEVELLDTKKLLIRSKATIIFEGSLMV